MADPTSRGESAGDRAAWTAVPGAQSEENVTGGAAQGGAPALFILGALAAGALIAGATGFDLFERPRDKVIERLTQDRRDLQARVDYLSGEVVRLELAASEAAPRSRAVSRDAASRDGDGDGSTVELPTAGELRGRLAAGRWEELAAGVAALLRAGDEGFGRLVEALRLEVPGRLETLRGGAALFPLLRVIVEREDDVARFLSFALASEPFRRDRRLREWLLRWGAWFIAGSPGRHAAARGALYQSLERHMKSGDAGIWVVLEGIELLEGRVPVYSIRELLEESEREDVHGFLLKSLERRGDAEAVRILRQYVEARRGRVDWRVSMALEALGRIDRDDARRALEELMHASEPELREAATVAFHANRHDPRTDVDPLLRFLNSDTPMRLKRRVLGRIRNANPELFAALGERAGAVTSDTLRHALEGAGGPVRASFSKER